MARRKPKPSKHTAQEPKRGRGRPSDFRPELCHVVTKLARLGLTDEEMADVLEKPIGTFDRWKAKHPEFREAIKKGKVETDANVANRLYQRAKGFEWEEQQAIKLKEIKFDASGRKISETERVEVVTVVKKAPPDTGAGIFWLCNRQRDKWRQKVDHEHSGKGGGPIIMYADDEGL